MEDKTVLPERNHKPLGKQLASAYEEHLSILCDLRTIQVTV